MASLATKYRPHKWEDVVGQEAIMRTLNNQLKNKNYHNAYMFVGGAGTGKTTSARLFANSINGDSNSIDIIEIDAASYNSADDMRKIVDEASLSPIVSPYKIYIIDEVHVLSKTAFNVMLKCLEEPPKRTIFILCTTNPEKVLPTIVSRCEVYRFSKISDEGISNRLEYIINKENEEGSNITYTKEALDYIAKKALGGMRLAITYLDSTISYSNDITVDSAVTTIGTVGYDKMLSLTESVTRMNGIGCVEIINDVYYSGIDIVQFICDYTEFVLDLCKYDLMKSFKYISIPSMYADKLKSFSADEYKFFTNLLDAMIELRKMVKNESNPKAIIEAQFVLLCSEG